MNDNLFFYINMLDVSFVGVAQLLHLKPLEDKGFVQPPIILDHNDVNYHLFAMICRNVKERDGLIQFLKEHKIGAVFHYIPLHSYPEGKKVSRIIGDRLPITDRISECLIRIPVYYEILLKNKIRW